MVGKTIQLSARKIVFLHEESGNQWHKKLDSPGGIDEVVIRWIKRAGVSEVHHYSKEQKRLYIASINAFTRENSQAIRQVSDGRMRLYLPTREWKTVRHMPYQPPWVTAVVKLTVTERQPVEEQVALGI